MTTFWSLWAFVPRSPDWLPPPMSEDQFEIATERFGHRAEVISNGKSSLEGSRWYLTDLRSLVTVLSGQDESVGRGDVASVL